jgi:hypothetical protein
MAGGVGDYTRRLNAMLTHQGHEVAVITGNQGQAYRDAARVYPVRVPVWNGAGIASVRQTISKLQPEIVHIQYQTGAYQMKIAINTLPGALKRERQKGLRVVTTAHDLLPPYLFPKAGKIRDWYTKRIIREADGAVLTNAGDYHTVMNDPRGAWNPHAVFIPLAFEYTFGQERHPEIFIRFGSPQTGNELGADVLSARATLERSMETNQDALKDAVCFRTPDSFTTLLTGRGGASAPYDLWRKFKASMSGTSVNLNHGNL